jgi:putative colanic acid biosynthesis acetyltransferase WcaF
MHHVSGLKRQLNRYDNSGFDPGRGVALRLLWFYSSLIFIESGWFPVYTFKLWLLRLFGASIGPGVIIKPRVRIKYPWNLEVGEYCWIGEDAWIDNLATVKLGPHSVISQGAYLCTGSHDHRSETFDLVTRPIIIGHGAWICARAIILPGAVIADQQVVPAGSVVGREKRPAGSG